jgi:hypothetical protein
MSGKMGGEKLDPDRLIEIFSSSETREELNLKLAVEGISWKDFKDVLSDEGFLLLAVEGLVNERVRDIYECRHFSADQETQAPVQNWNGLLMQLVFDKTVEKEKLDRAITRFRIKNKRDYFRVAISEIIQKTIENYDNYRAI